MPDRLKRAGGLALLLPLLGLSGCLYATGGVRTFEVRSEPGAVVVTDTTPALVPGPSAVERAYIRDTARVVFKRRDVERAEGFVFAEPGRGYGVCIRAGWDTALLVLQRRVFEPGISQVEDDATILRRDADTAVCRARRDWTAA